MNKQSIGIAACGALMLASAAHADVMFTSQTRSVEASIRSWPAMQSFTAPDFATFDATAFVRSAEAQCSALATQLSSLTPEVITARGLVDPQDGIQIYGGEAQSLFDVTFSVTELTPFRLMGGWTALGFGNNKAEVELIGPSGSIFKSGYTVTMEIYRQTFDVSGELAPGQYRLVGLTNGVAQRTGGGIIAGGTFDLTMQVPGPGTLAVLPALGLMLRRR